MQLLLDGAGLIRCEQAGIDRPLGAFHVEGVDALAGQRADCGIGVQRHLDRGAAAFRQVVRDRAAHACRRAESGHGKRAEIELQRLRFDEVRRFGRHDDLRGRDLGFAVVAEPGEFPRIPDVHAGERQGSDDPERLATVTASDRTKHFGRVLLRIVGRVSQR